MRAGQRNITLHPRLEEWKSFLWSGGRGLTERNFKKDKKSLETLGESEKSSSESSTVMKRGGKTKRRQVVSQHAASPTVTKRPSWS